MPALRIDKNAFSYPLPVASKNKMRLSRRIAKPQSMSVAEHLATTEDHVFQENESHSEVERKTPKQKLFIPQDLAICTLFSISAVALNNLTPPEFLGIPPLPFPLTSTERSAFRTKDGKVRSRALQLSFLTSNFKLYDGSSV